MLSSCKQFINGTQILGFNSWLPLNSDLIFYLLFDLDCHIRGCINWRLNCATTFLHNTHRCPKKHFLKTKYAHSISCSKHFSDSESQNMRSLLNSRKNEEFSITNLFPQSTVHLKWFYNASVFKGSECVCWLLVSWKVDRRVCKVDIQ